jgi:SAM-dependent methyltransferase
MVVITRLRNRFSMLAIVGACAPAAKPARTRHTGGTLGQQSRTRGKCARCDRRHADDRAVTGDARAGLHAALGIAIGLGREPVSHHRLAAPLNFDFPRPTRSPHMNAPIDFSALKTRQQTAWASGDYAVIGTTLQLVGELLAEACDLRCDERVLDVAAGNGNVTLAAARRGCTVTSTDYVAALLDRGAERARAERLEVTFEVADAEALPYDDASFDAVLSTFGVMFAPDQAKAASELARVCRPGGRIGLANWTPEGFIGQLFKTLGRQLPPPAGLQPPSLWGVEAHLHTLFGERAAGIAVTRRLFNFRYRSAAHFIDVFRTWYGPVNKAFAALPADKALVLEHDLTDLLNGMNRAGAASLVVPSEYLEIVVTRR